MPNKFTWFPKLTRVLEALPPEHVAEMALAIAQYGTDGAEPEFSTPILMAVFEGVREDIDASVNARTCNKGGRPRKEIAGKTGVSDLENPPKQGLEVVSETENPSYKNKDRDKDKDKNKNKDKNTKSKERRTPPSERPTAEQVEEYAKSKSINIDAAQFVDYYAAQGWKLANGRPLKDWRAAVRNWARRERARGQPTQAHELQRFEDYDF